MGPLSRGAVLAAALALGGCVSIVQVQADGGRPHLSAWPFGVRVDRGSADAVAVRHVTLGVSHECGMTGVGVSVVRCVVIDPSSCGVAVVEVRAPADLSRLREISDLSREICLHRKDPSK